METSLPTLSCFSPHTLTPMAFLVPFPLQDYDMLTCNHRLCFGHYLLFSVCFEPTSMAKAARAARAGILSFASLVTPNIRELIAMSHALASLETSDDAFTQSLASCDSVPLPEIEEHVRVLMARGGVSEVVVKLGARGALAAIMSGALLLFHPRGS